MVCKGRCWFDFISCPLLLVNRPIRGPRLESPSSPQTTEPKDLDGDGPEQRNSRNQSTSMGALAVTSKISDKKFCTFKIPLSWRFPRKTTCLDDFPLCPQCSPIQNSKLYFYCLAVSEKRTCSECRQFSALSTRGHHGL